MGTIFRKDAKRIESPNALNGIKGAIVKLWDDESNSGAGAVPAAYLVPENQALPSPGDIRRQLRAKLPGHMIPAAFVRIHEIPLGRSGKADRNRLPMPSQSSDG